MGGVYQEGVGYSRMVWGYNGYREHIGKGGVSEVIAGLG